MFFFPTISYETFFLKIVRNFISTETTQKSSAISKKRRETNELFDVQHADEHLSSQTAQPQVLEEQTIGQHHRLRPHLQGPLPRQHPHSLRQRGGVLGEAPADPVEGVRRQPHESADPHGADGRPVRHQGRHEVVRHHGVLGVPDHVLRRPGPAVPRPLLLDLPAREAQDEAGDEVPRRPLPQAGTRGRADRAPQGSFGTRPAGVQERESEFSK